MYLMCVFPYIFYINIDILNIFAAMKMSSPTNESCQVVGRRPEILAKSYTTFGRPLVSRTAGEL